MPIWGAWMRDNARLHHLMRGLVLTLTAFAGGAIILLWWALFALPTDQAGGMSSAEGLVVTYLNVPSETSSLQLGDVLVNIRGYTLQEWLEPNLARSVALLRDSREGQSAAYVVRRGDALTTVTLPLVRVPPLEGLKRVALMLPVVLSFLLIGAFVAWRRPGDPAARVLFLCFWAIVLNVADDPINEANLTWLFALNPLIHSVEIVTFWLVASLGLHFSLIFPRPHPWAQRCPWIVWTIHLVNPVVCLVTALMVGGPVLFGLFTSQAESARYVVGGVETLWMMANVARSILVARTPVERAQMRWLAWGTAAGVGPWLTGFIAPLLIGGVRLGIVQTAVLWLLLAALPLAFAFAILRYRLMDIDAVIHRSLVYGALSAVLVAVYLLLATGLSRFFLALSGRSDDTTVVFLATLGAALVFAPARTRVQRAIDHVFYRQQLNLPALLAEWSKTLATTLDIHHLDALMVKVVPARLGLEHAGMWTWNESRQCFVRPDGEELAGGEARRALPDALLAANAPIIINPPDASPDPVLTPLRALGMEVASPLVVGARLLGLYAVGAKRSGAWYNRTDIEFLETLGHQAAVALENSRLIEQLTEQERIKHELDIARTIQTSLLPARDPDWPGLEVYGTSLPAREVGGDFYTYLTLSNGAAAVAVGDVSGKGVPGALFMAVALGVMRVQARAIHNAADLLQALNGALYEQMAATHMNVALLYAIFERADGGAWRLCASNGGLIAPLLLLHTGECEYMDTGGLPLGAAERASYDQVQVSLSHGDVVVLCSDGIVEAMNESRELFSFSRLQQTLVSLRGCDAAGIARGLIEAARDFARPSEFDDDATIVVIRLV